MLNITDIRVRLVNKEDLKLKAVASFTIDDCFVVRDVRVVEGAKGLFVSMPSQKNKYGKFRDMCHPINTETRTSLDRAILEAYKKALSEQASV